MVKKAVTRNRSPPELLSRENEAGPSQSRSHGVSSYTSSSSRASASDNEQSGGNEDSDSTITDNEESDDGSSVALPDEEEGFGRGMDVSGFVGASPSHVDANSKTVKPLTPEALAAFRAAQEQAGVIYISRIPPGMRPTKVRHLMSQYGEVGRVYLQQEDPKRAYLRKKYTSTKKPHFTEGWVEFTDKRVARSVAEMLNARPIGGKKGTRWRDDVWTMKYLPRFKWNMLTEQIANEAAIKTARLRVELEQSRREQKDYLRQVELARVLDKRAKRKREALEKRGERVDDEMALLPPLKRKARDPTAVEDVGNGGEREKGERKANERRRERVGGMKHDSGQLKKVLGSVF